MKNIILAIVVTAAVTGAGAFYGGMRYAQAQRATNSQRFAQFGSLGTRGTRASGVGGFAGGQIVSVDGSSVSVKDQNGGSRIVFYSPSTSVTKSVSGSVADLKVGDDIVVAGTANQDGSVTAQTIRINPVAFPDKTP